jgi:rare lipoprotein A
LNLKTPLWIAVMAGASSVALAAGVLLFSTRTVQADARLLRPAATMPPPAPALDAEPALLAPRITAEELRAYRLHGVASWYGGVFNGRKTASGERFDMFALTACHPTLPFGTLVRVVNRSNKRSVVVRINDRGDLVDEGRIIDLSYAAAEKLAMIQPGLAHVDLEVISLGRTGLSR